MKKYSLRIGLLAILGVTFIYAVEFRGQALQDTWDMMARFIGLQGPPEPASPARFSDHEIERLPKMSPQEQAELLLGASAAHYKGAIELLETYVGSWRGRLKRTQRLNGKISMAFASNDLRVRAAAIEVNLALYNIPKAPQSLDQLEAITKTADSDQKQTAVWMMGLLANRGVQPDRVQEVLSTYVLDPDEKIRYWAVEGMGMIGSDATIPVLLGVFHDDSSGRVRERAACNLAQSGMLSHAQRQNAVPELLKFMDDPALDAETRSWVFQALTDITGQVLPSDPAAWRNWYSSQEHSSGR